jgi:hypothetical protein
MGETCNCEFCRAYAKYIWAVIMECKCGCHYDDIPSGHDSLCCEFPNGRRKDNPYSDLLPASEYKAVLDKWKKEANEEI